MRAEEERVLEECASEGNVWLEKIRARSAREEKEEEESRKCEENDERSSTKEQQERRHKKECEEEGGEHGKHAEGRNKGMLEGREEIVQWKMQKEYI